MITFKSKYGISKQGIISDLITAVVRPAWNESHPRTSRHHYSLPEAHESFLMEESVKAGVSLTSLSHDSSEGDDALLSSHLSVFVNLKM